MGRGRKPLFNTGKAYWKSKGLCMDCGKEIDRPGHYVRCAACREIRMMQQKLRRDKAEAQTEAETLPANEKEERSQRAKQIHAEAVKLQTERARLREQLDRCEVCPFARFVGAGMWFCPLPYCIHENGV